GELAGGTSEVVGVPGEAKVAERVDVDDRALELSLAHLWLGEPDGHERSRVNRGADLAEVAADREIRRDRREDVAAMKRAACSAEHPRPVLEQAGLADATQLLRRR